MKNYELIQHDSTIKSDKNKTITNIKRVKIFIF